MSTTMRVLLVADTHLGFDLPLRPRVERCRRGPDFFANLERALIPAHRGEVDLVVHGGDLLYRSKVPARLVSMAFEPLLRVADRGVPVVVVPGNHERSSIPYPLLAAHSKLHIFDRPRTIRLRLGGISVALAGFPCQRNGIRDRFPDLLAATGWQEQPADISLLCLHQTIEGARVGPADYTFRSGPDILRGRDLPSGFAAVLAGHIHRHQVLTSDLAGRPLAAPVLYPGAIERTSTAERNEPKGYLTLVLEPDGQGGALLDWQFHQLPARPMVDLELDATGLAAEHLRTELARSLAGLDTTAVVRVRISGTVRADAAHVITAATLRSLAPPTMIVSWHRSEAIQQAGR